MKDLLILLCCTVNRVNQNHTAGPYADSARPSFFSDMAYKPRGARSECCISREHTITLSHPYNHRDILHGLISALGLVNSCVVLSRSAATTTIGLEDIYARCKGAGQNISVLEV